MKHGASISIVEIGVMIDKIRSEIEKAAFQLMFNLKLNFFANYSAVV